MGQRSSDAVVKNAPIMPSMEECVLNMECRSSYEGAKDAQIAGGGVCKRHGPTHSQTVIDCAVYIEELQTKQSSGVGSATQTLPNQRASRADSGEKKKEGNASGKVTVLSQEIVACLGGGMIFWDSSSTK
eukprot:scaffold29160_cov78-Skeletonema_dohrnii-CCMP3373.AAC.1